MSARPVDVVAVLRMFVERGRGVKEKHNVFDELAANRLRAALAACGAQP